ncbi:MAG TPA: DNA polymerase III subunit gamma/tau [Thermoleophilia bacterium]|nr:DNA polymerase III subunit gamma/tau [Thermoleophilia bacterium]
MKRSLYREYRPQTLTELIGQDHVARTLRNAVETDAVAHAYVFSGPRGTGKTSTARILAKTLNCIGTPDAPVERPTPTPCGVCRHCVAVADGVSLDVVEMDAASNNGIDDIRDLRDKIAFAPVHGRFKVYIIDEVHMLSTAAFNALLKTLEEPPANVVFVLATTEPHKIPETIISRCQRFDFRRPQVRDITRLLASIVERENAREDAERDGPRIDIQDAALEEIARHSQGGFRDAIGTLDKLIAYSEGAIGPTDVLEALGATDADLLFELTDIIIERRTAEALQFVQRLAHDGIDYSQFIRDLLRHLRQVFLLQHLEDAARDEASLRILGQTVELDEQRLTRLLPQANNLHPREVVHLIEKLGEAQREIRDGLDPRLQLELALVKATRPQLDHTAAALEERLRRLEADAAVAAVRPVSSSDQPREAGASPTVPPTRADGAQAKRDPETVIVVQATAGRDVEQEACAQSPEAEVSTPTIELSLERVRRAWDLILQRVQASSVSLYAMLRESRPATLEGELLTISIPSNLALMRACEPGNAELLAAAAEGALGVPLRAIFVPAEGSAGSPAPAEPAPPPQDYDFTAQIRHAQETLDAERLPDEPQGEH